MGASTEGLLIYSLDETMTFDPSDLDLEVTPDNVNKCVDERMFSKALMMSLSLNEEPLIQQVVESCPYEDISLIVRSLPQHRLQRVLDLISKVLGSSPHLEFYLIWARAILTFHGDFLKTSSNRLLPTFRSLYKTINTQYNDLTNICSDNKYMLAYMSSFATHKIVEEAVTEEQPDGALSTPSPFKKTKLQPE